MSVVCGEMVHNRFFSVFARLVSVVCGEMALGRFFSVFARLLFGVSVLKANLPYLCCFSGRRRLEPMAIVILSVIMSLASFQVIIESVQKIVAFTSDKTGAPKFEVPTIVITACTVGE